MRVTAGAMRAGVLVLLAAGAGGCKPDEAGPARENTVATDTGALGGLTPAQIRARAEPMSPEQAESLGIVDTTIHVESQESIDTIPILRKPANP